MEKFPRPEISVIVPIFNEAENLTAFFGTLRRQRGVAFELILSDGGSCDGTEKATERCKGETPFPVTLLRGEKGRARQLNAGARAAAGHFLLFAHVDSDWPDPLALRRSLDVLDLSIREGGSDRVAGHFPLRFRRQDPLPSLAYTYYEAKARLDRPECTHGDQGFLLPRTFFERIGPFDESLPLLEDTRLAEAIRREGKWVLLPAEIWTSARRFETEGLYERQFLNALIMNFAAMGWDRFFLEARGIYRSQDQAGKLRLAPFLILLRRLEKDMVPGEWARRWLATGRYVRANAWQVVLAMEVWRQFRKGVSLEKMTFGNLERFDKAWDRLTNHLPGHGAAAVLTWFWIRWICLRHRMPQREHAPSKEAQ